MNRSNRQLAAIMFTDIVGYTALMGSDEAKALSVLKTNRSIHKRLIKKYGGKWLKEMGDGTLASFKTIMDSVLCAGQLIRSCNEQNIKLTIGIHFGDIVEEQGDIFGDGVNVASRLEQIAAPNQIIVSRPIHSNIKNKNGIKSTFLEEKELKNVDEPVRIYEVEIDRSTYEKAEQGNSETSKNIGLHRKLIISVISVFVLVTAIIFFYNHSKDLNTSNPELNLSDVHKSIAVLPFKDMSPEQDQEYLGDGVAEEIINRLTKVEDLKVIGRTSSFSFKNKDTDLKSIGEMLDVETILEGSVQKSGNQLRITVQLINAEDGFHIWSESYDREFKDVFSIQDELAHLVVSKMLDVPASENNIIYTNEKISSEAYEYFLKGKHIHDMYSMNKNIEDFKTSENLFLRAIDIDPKFGLAHAGLADLYNSIINLNMVNANFPDGQEYLELQKRHIQLAYQLDPYSDYVSNVKGFVYLAFDEYDSAHSSFIEAIQLNPNAGNLGALAGFLQSIGLYNEALRLLIEAKNIDPLDVLVLLQMVIINRSLGNLSLAIDDVDDLILIEPTFIGNYILKIEILVGLNKIDKAYDLLLKSKEINPEFNFSYFEGFIYAAKNDKEKALKINNESGRYFALLGMKEEYIASILTPNSNAFDWHRAVSVKTRTDYIPMIHSEYYDWIKDDPRIQEFEKKEKEKYDRLKAKYGNLDFLDL